MFFGKNTVANITCQSCGSTDVILITDDDRKEISVKCAICHDVFLLPVGKPVKSYHDKPNCKSYLLTLDVEEKPILKAEPEKQVQNAKAEDRAVSAIVVCHNRLNLTQRCIDCVRKSNIKCEIVLVDNASTDDTLNWAEKQKDIVYIRNRINLGCGIARNQGVSWASEDYLFFLDNDQFISPDTLDKLFKRTANADLIGVELWKIAGAEGGVSGADRISHLAYIGSGGMLVKKETFEGLNGYDERYAPAWYADVDFCFRAKYAGYKIDYIVDAGVTHLSGQTVSIQKDYDSAIAKKQSQKLFASIWSDHIFRKQKPNNLKPFKKNLLDLQISQEAKYKYISIVT